MPPAFRLAATSEPGRSQRCACLLETGQERGRDTASSRPRVQPISEFESGLLVSEKSVGLEAKQGDQHRGRGEKKEKPSRCQSRTFDGGTHRNALLNVPASPAIVPRLRTRSRRHPCAPLTHSPRKCLCSSMVRAWQNDQMHGGGKQASGEARTPGRQLAAYCRSHGEPDVADWPAQRGPQASVDRIWQSRDK